MADTRETAKADHRTLHFDSIDEVIAEVDRLVEADRAGTLKRTGNWSPGKTFGHLASWIDYGYDGYPFNAPWFVRALGRMMKKGYIRKPMKPGFRIPRAEAGTYGVEEMSTEEGAARLKRALERLKNREEPKFDSPVLGPMSMDDRIALNLRHAELHLGFLRVEED